MTRIIAVASGKGGVGKTTTVANLGVALAKLRKNVIILDANFTTPNLGLHLGIHGNRVTLNDVMEGNANLTDAIYLHPSGLRIIPAGLHIKHLNTTDPTRLWDVVLDLFGSADVVLLDTPAGLEGGARAVLDASEEVLLVTNPETPAIADGLRTVRIAQQSGAQVIGVALNKFMKDEKHVTASHVESLLDLPVLAQIPYDQEVPRSINHKIPIVERLPKSPAAQAYKKLAADLMGVEYEIEARGRPVVHILKKMFGLAK